MKQKQPALLDGIEVEQLDDKVLRLMQRLGIQAFPPHETREIALERLVVPGRERIRLSKDSLFVTSIARVGVLEPPAVVLTTGEGLDDLAATFEVMFGRRRVVGAELAKRRVVKCEAYAWTTPQFTSLLALIENEQRASAWIKEVQDLRSLMEEKVGMTLDDLAAFGFDRRSLKKRLRIAQLPFPLLQQIYAGSINQALAKDLANLKQAQLAKLAALAEQGQTISAALVRQELRFQVNRGLAPLYAAAVVPGAPLATNGTNATAPHPSPGVFRPDAGGVEATKVPSDGPGLTLASLLALLRTFESRLSHTPITKNMRLLARALIQEVESAARADEPILQAQEEHHVR
jgi:hypothetical protein